MKKHFEDGTYCYPLKFSTIFTCLLILFKGCNMMIQTMTSYSAFYRAFSFCLNLRLAFMSFSGAALRLHSNSE